MYAYEYPQNFKHLVDMMHNLQFEDFVENDDTGVNRMVEIGNMTGGRYEMYEDGEFVGCTSKVVEAAEFIAEGWEGR